MMLKLLSYTGGKNNLLALKELAIWGKGLALTESGQILTGQMSLNHALSILNLKFIDVMRLLLRDSGSPSLQALKDLVTWGQELALTESRQTLTAQEGLNYAEEVRLSPYLTKRPDTPPATTCCDASPSTTCPINLNYPTVITILSDPSPKCPRAKAERISLYPS